MQLRPTPRIVTLREEERQPYPKEVPKMNRILLQGCQNS